MSVDCRVFDAIPAQSEYRGSRSCLFGVEGDNGKVYGVPGYSQKVLEVDPANDTVEPIGSLLPETFAGSKWADGVLSLGKIYCVPDCHNRILVIDPMRRETRLIGPVLEKKMSGAAFGAAVLGPNNKIYGIPFCFNRVLVIDPSNDDNVCFIGPLFSGKRMSLWSHGVLAPNGKIYGIPFAHARVLEIDCHNDTVQLIGDTDLLYSPYKWSHGVLCNNMVYGIPYHGTRNHVPVLRIDPCQRTTTAIADGPHLNGYGRSQGVVVSGKVYAVPHVPSSIMKFDPQQNRVTQIRAPSMINGSQMYSNGLLGPDGNIYCIPREGSRILMLRPGQNDAVSCTTVPYTGDYAGWHGARLTRDRRHVLAFPARYSGNTLLKISFCRWDAIGTHIVLRELLAQRRAEPTNELGRFLYRDSPMGVFATCLGYL